MTVRERGKLREMTEREERSRMRERDEERDCRERRFKRGRMRERDEERWRRRDGSEIMTEGGRGENFLFSIYSVLFMRAQKFLLIFKGGGALSSG